MRPGWRDAVQTAADLALVGFAATLACLPVVTAGAALLTASRAVGHHLATGSWPSGRVVRADFRRLLLPGLAASAALAVVACFLVVDAVVLSSGRVPGGPPALAAVLIAALLIAGLLIAGLTGLA